MLTQMLSYKSYEKFIFIWQIKEIFNLKLNPIETFPNSWDKVKFCGLPNQPNKSWFNYAIISVKIV